MEGIRWLKSGRLLYFQYSFSYISYNSLRSFCVNNASNHPFLLRFMDMSKHPQNYLLIAKLFLCFIEALRDLLLDKMYPQWEQKWKKNVISPYVALSSCIAALPGKLRREISCNGKQLDKLASFHSGSARSQPRNFLSIDTYNPEIIF